MNTLPEGLSSQSAHMFTRRAFLAASGALAIGVLAGCGNGSEANLVQPETTEAGLPDGETVGLADSATKLRAARIISTFENSTTEIQYGYAEDIQDGRGITAGRAGFTSGTHDMLLVVQRYVDAEPGNSLESYLPALQRVDGTESTAGLDGLPQAWRHASDDPTFRDVQDKVVDELYFKPAMKWAEKAQQRTAIGQLILWDTIIQHGEGDDPDGLPALVQEANLVQLPNQVNELAWLQNFLQIRRHHLENAADPATRQGWRESVDRVVALKSILDSGNTSLTPPLAWNVYGDPFTLTS